MYQEFIVELKNEGFENLIPILDSKNEINYYKEHLKGQTKIGIRIASEEEPTFEFYSSRLGIRYKDILQFYEEQIKSDSRFELKMLHFFINSGIRDNVYYWSELSKCLQVYCDLKKICPELDSLNIGGGLPIRNSLAFEFDYEYMVEEIIRQIKAFCNQQGVEEPNIFTEFGSYTVGESGATLFSIIDLKQQNDTESWYMIDSSFITTLPDTWGINQRFILLAINHWNTEYKRVNLGGLTCDSLDYYNAEAHISQVFLPKVEEDEIQSDPLYIGFFHTGAYQESLGGYGGIQHCLIPAPKHVIISKDENGELSTYIFGKEQSYKSMLKTLGYY
jgi:arginine decarboxylase